MKSESPSYVRHPKLSRYFRSDTSAVRRLRSLLAFCAAASVLDQRLFFLDCHSSVFKCVGDAIQQIEAEAVASTDGVDAASLLSDSQCVLDVLGALMAESPHLIKGKWQLRPIYHILQQALSHFTHLALRRHALSVLMRLIGILGSAEEPSLLALLASSVDFTLFLPSAALQSPFAHFLHSSPCHRQPLLFAWSLPAVRPSVSERRSGECDLLRQLLAATLQRSDYIVSHSFPFWLRTVQTHLMPLLYRGLFTPFDPTLLPLGFSPLPPVPLHSCVVDWLLRAAELDNGACLLPNAAALDSLLSLLRLTFVLPPSAAACQLQVVTLYEQWLRGEQLPALLRGKTDELARVVVDHTASLLTYNSLVDTEGDTSDEDELSAGRLSYDEREKARSVSEQMETAHVHTCDRVLTVWSSLCEQRECSVSEATCDYVLHSLLRVCDVLLHRSQPTPGTLLRSLLSCLLTCFLSTSAEVAPPLWQQLQAMLRSWLMKHPEVLDSWAAVMGQWTDRLLHALAMEDAHVQQACADGSASHATSTQLLTARPPALMDVAEIHPSSAASDSWSEPLPFQRIFDRWLLLLRLPGSPLSVSSGRVRLSVLAGLHSSLATLLSALQRPHTVTAPRTAGRSAVTLAVPRHTLPSCNTLLLLFGGWLLDCCLHTLNNAVSPIGQQLPQPRLVTLTDAPLSAYSFDSHLEQSSPFAAACLLLTTRSAAPLDARWLSSLYHIVRLALSSNQTDILYTVLRHCTSLFTSESSSGHVLIPDFLHVIKRLLMQAAVAAPAARSALRSASSASSHSVFSYTTPNTPLHDSMGQSHTPLQKRDRTRISLLSEEGEAQLTGEDEGDEEAEQQWLKQHLTRSSSLHLSPHQANTASANVSSVQADTHPAGQHQHSHTQRDQLPRTPALVEEDNDSDDRPPVSVRLSCLSILHSWIALPFLFPHAAISQLFPLHAESSPLHVDTTRLPSDAVQGSVKAAVAPPALTYWSLRAELLHITIRSLRHDPSPAVQSACVWALHLLLQLELHQANSHSQSLADTSDGGHLVCRCLAAILTCCRPSIGASVCHTAIEALRTAVEALSAAPTRRWSHGYSKLRLSLGLGADRRRDAAGAEEDDHGDADGSKRDSDEEAHINPSAAVHSFVQTPSPHQLPTSAIHQLEGGGSSNNGSGSSISAVRRKERRPLLFLVVVDSLCAVAAQQLQAFVITLNVTYQPSTPSQTTLPSTAAPAPQSLFRSSNDYFSVSAQLVSTLFLTLLEYVMSFPPLLSPSSAVWSLPSCVRVRRSLFVLLQSALTLRSEQSAVLRDRVHTSAGSQRAASFSPAFAAPATVNALSGRSRAKLADPSGAAAARGLARGSSSPPLTPPRKPAAVQFDAGGQSAASSHQLPTAFLLACSTIEETAAALLRHLLTRMHHYPTQQSLGPEQVVSVVCEEDDQGAEEPAEDSRLHVVLDESTVVTLYHLNSDHSSDTARLVVRDMTGKYAWDVKQVKEADSQLTQRVRRQRKERVAEAEWACMQHYNQQSPRASFISRWGGRASAGVQGDSSGEEDADDTMHLTEMDASQRSTAIDDSEQYEESEEDDYCTDNNDSGDELHANTEESSASLQLDVSRDDEQDGDDNRDDERQVDAAVERVEEADRLRMRVLEDPPADAGSSGSSTALGAPRIDSDGNYSTLYVSWTDVHIVESFHAPPDFTAPRFRRQTSDGRNEARDESRSGARSGGSHLRHFLQVRRRRHELQQQAADRPRSLSQVSAASSPILPPSPSFHAVGSMDTASPLLTAVAASSLSDPVTSSVPLPPPSFTLSLSPALSAYPAVRFFASDLFFPSTSASVSPLPSAPVFLPDNHKVRRALRLLDRVAVRESVKVGVLYCGRGQDSQRAILSNEAGSAAYEQFVSGLGWEVALSSHRGFTGGLDSSERAVYFSNSTCELMWHVATRMLPTSTDELGNERTVLRRKRHVGNDYVHVVWSEHWLDYAADTVSSHFNHVHIVLYPVYIHQLEQQQQRTPVACRVQVFSKPSVPLFGPLHSHMVVPLPCLPGLVRLTAINANRAIRHSTPDYQPPYPTRRALLTELVSKAAIGGRQLHALTAAVTQHDDGSDDDSYH